ncbi:extracellular sulfatase Sulf-2-like [Diretmus argenteus]
MARRLVGQRNVPLGDRKLLHQRVEGKEVSQEENFLPKHQRVKDLCQRAEYQTPCQQTGQKWQCVEDATGKLRLFKCKNEGGAKGAKNLQRGVASRQRPISIKSQLYQRNSEACDCDLRPPNLRPSILRPFNKKSFFSKKSRCLILANETVKCDTGVYQSLQAWKDHKLHIDHEIETLQTKIKNLREVRGHLKKARPLECDCNKYLYKSKVKSKMRYRGGGLHPFRKGGVRDKKAWLMKEQKRRKKMRKMMKRIRNNDTCSMPGLTCFTHDNQHWHTAPYWTLGSFCACTSANNNTYWCLRTINESHNFLFCEFATGFLEYFDLNTDPYQLMNAVSSLDRTVLNQLHVQLMELRGCKGHKQCNPRTRSVEQGEREHDSFDDYRLFERRKWPRVKRPSSSRALETLRRSIQRTSSSSDPSFPSAPPSSSPPYLSSEEGSSGGRSLGEEVEEEEDDDVEEDEEEWRRWRQRDKQVER